MIFKKGSEVEVLNTREVPTGAWWCAEIISGDGRVYNVRYNHHLPGVCNDVERVPRKAIRPSPPVLKLSCVPGDMIEAIHGGSWKIAEVLRELDGKNFSVRLLGSSLILNIHFSKLRLRQVWEDNKWVVIKKNISRIKMPETCRHGKRKSESLLLQDAGNAKKPKKCQLFKGRVISSKDWMERSQTETKCQTIKTSAALPVGRSSEDDNLESDACSTCSSSGSNYPDVSAGCNRDLDDYSNDVHSFPTDIDAEVHELELHAYCKMMKVLYASGPISWEQEALLTSLRLLLHISTDEHLSILKHLLSGPDLGAVKLASKVQDDMGLTTLLSLGPMRQLSIIFTVLVSFYCFSVKLLKFFMFIANSQWMHGYEPKLDSNHSLWNLTYIIPKFTFSLLHTC